MSGKITFYGHFTGWWSYAAVCREIAKYLHAALGDEGVELVDLTAPSPSIDEASCFAGVKHVPRNDRLVAYVHRKFAIMQMGVTPSRLKKSGSALVFTNPNNLPAIPQHGNMAVYAVCEGHLAPASWVEQLNDRADVVLAPSTWTAQALARSGVQRNIHVVRHGVDSDLFRPKGDVARSKIRFFCTSEQGNRKGLQEFCCALDQLSIYRPDVLEQVVIHTPWANLIDDIVKTTAWGADIDYEEKPVGPPAAMAELLQRTKLLVAPSRAEGFGLLPLEAACCGCPVVVSDATGHQEFTRHKAFLRNTRTYIVDEGPREVLDARLDEDVMAPTIDPTRLAEVILLALSGARQRPEQGLNVSRFLHHAFSWERVLHVDGLLQHLQP